MDCERCRDALSATMDGEDPGVSETVVRDHVASCPSCAAFAEGAARLHRTARVTAADAVPDLTDPILRSIGDQPTAAAVDERARFLRISLVVIGAIQLGMALPALVLGDDSGLPVHVARHLGSFALALGVGLLVVAWRPERASGVLPVVAALVVCIVGSSVLDIVQGNAVPGAEVGHAPELVGLVAVWLLTRVPEEHARHRPRPVLG